MTDPKEVAKVARELVLAMERFANLLDGVTGKAPATTATEKPQREPKTVTRPRKEIYDNDPSSPTYDPEPPFQVEKVPPRPAPQFKDTIIFAGEVKKCSACRKPAVKAKVDMDANNIRLDNFEILGTSDWAERVDVNKQGGICVTCPLCGHLNLWLIGEPPKHDSMNI